MHIGKKLLSALFALVLVLSLLPAALAEEVLPVSPAEEPALAEELPAAEAAPVEEEAALPESGGPAAPLAEEEEQSAAPLAAEAAPEEMTFEVALPDETVSAEAEAASSGRNGWYQAGSNWYYYRNGALVRNEWIQSNGKWYYFKSTGVMCAKEMLLMSNAVDRYMFGADGAMLTNCWVQPDSSWRSSFVSSSYQSRMESGWYYCGSDGRLYNDRWLQYKGHWYLFYGSGAMIVDEI